MFGLLIVKHARHESLHNGDHVVRIPYCRKYKNQKETLAHMNLIYEQIGKKELVAVEIDMMYSSHAQETSTLAVVMLTKLIVYI